MANVTIPALPVWGLGPNPLTGQELFEISPTSSTATPSSQLSLLNLAKFPMILPSAVQNAITLNPSSFILAGYSVGSAIAVGVTINQLQVSAGNLPTGGTTGQPLVKNSNTNFDVSFATLGVVGGGIGLTSVASLAMLYGNGTSALGVTNTATNGVLITSATGTPTVASTLPGAVQLNITEVGTIGTGVWNGTVITPSFGGTGATTTPSAGAILVGQTSTQSTWEAMLGDVALSSGGTATIATSAVTFAKIQTMTGLSVMGVAGTATTHASTIVGTAGQVLQVNAGGTALAFTTLSVSSSNISGIISVPNGGTGDSTMTSFGLLIGSGTNPISTLPVPSAGQVLLGQTTTSSPAWETAVGDWTITAGGTATIANGAVTAPKLATGAVVSTSILAGNVVFTSIQTMTGLSVMGVTGTATTNASTITGTTDQVLVVNHGGTAVLFGQINLGTSAAVTGLLAIANGGTNASVYTTALLNLNGVSLTGTNQTLSAGFNIITDNLGTASGTVTVAYGAGSLQKLISNGTFTLNATTATDGEADVLVTNATGASTITISNFNVGSNTGDTYATTVGNKYIFMARTISGSATYKWAALQ